MAVSIVHLFAHRNYAIHRILDTAPWCYKTDTGNRCPMVILPMHTNYVGFVSVVFVGITSNVTDMTQHQNEMLGRRSDLNKVDGDHLL